MHARRRNPTARFGGRVGLALAPASAVIACGPTTTETVDVQPWMSGVFSTVLVTGRASGIGSVTQYHLHDDFDGRRLVLRSDGVLTDGAFTWSALGEHEIAIEEDGDDEDRRLVWDEQSCEGRAGYVSDLGDFIYEGEVCIDTLAPCPEDESPPYPEQCGLHEAFYIARWCDAPPVDPCVPEG